MGHSLARQSQQTHTHRYTDTHAHTHWNTQQPFELQQLPVKQDTSRASSKIRETERENTSVVYEESKREESEREIETTTDRERDRTSN